MQPPSVVPAFHVGEQVAPGLIVGGVGSVVDQLGLQRMEEAFHGRVVQCVLAPAHGWPDAGAGQHVLLVGAGILG